MQKNIAIRLDGMLLGVTGNLDEIAHYMKNNLDEREYSALMRHIGGSMAELIEISSVLYSEFPDILPKELVPPKK